MRDTLFSPHLEWIIHAGGLLGSAPPPLQSPPDGAPQYSEMPPAPLQLPQDALPPVLQPTQEYAPPLQCQAYRPILSFTIASPASIARTLTRYSTSDTRIAHERV